MQAVGCHVFGGGFTQGVRKVLDVVGQVEIHGLGKDTVEQKLKLPFVMAPSWQGWRDSRSLWKKAPVCFGNPRCTAFSSMTGGYGEDNHGPNGKATCDVHDFCQFSIENNFKVAVWESVQQAWTVGKPLLDECTRRYFAPNGYRVAHVFINAATFGNSQHRKRYFYVAYKDNLRFNIVPPQVVEKHASMKDILDRPDLLRAKVTEGKLGSKYSWNYDENSHVELTTEEHLILPELRQNEGLNHLWRHRPEVFRARGCPGMAATADYATSDMPFSMHCLFKPRWEAACPTIHGSAGRFVHPLFPRPLSVRELSILMGWDEGIYPVGYNPVGQIGKGIVPAVGEWLAEQARMCIEGEWPKGEDFESSYNDKTCMWEGDNARGMLEKVFDLTRYVPDKPYPNESEREAA